MTTTVRALAYYDDSGFFYAMDTLGWNAIASITPWPTNDLFDATLSYAASPAQRSVQAGAQKGNPYQSFPCLPRTARTASFAGT